MYHNVAPHECIEVVQELLPQPPSSGSFRRGELKRCIRSNFEASASIELQDWPGLLDQVSNRLIAHCPTVVAGCPLRPVVQLFL